LHFAIYVASARPPESPGDPEHIANGRARVSP
jgi:hypothetical protein